MGEPIHQTKSSAGPIPWVPQPREPLSLYDKVLLTLAVLTAVAFIATFDRLLRKAAAVGVRRYLAARHLVLRAPLYRVRMFPKSVVEA